MVTRRRLLTLAVLAFALATVPAFAADRPKIVIEVIIDNGGTVREEEAQALLNNVLAGLANLHGRAMTDARIDLILTSNPTTVWSGSPRDLTRQAHAALDLVKLTDRCSDVGRALRQAEQNLKVAGADEAHLLIYSPLIFAPFPCDEGPGITLPQPVPEGIDLASMIGTYNIRTLKIFGVHPSQEPVWTEYLINAGILDRARDGSLDFAFLGFQQSKTFLARQKLLTREDG